IEWRPGQTLLARAIELAKAAGCRNVIVSGHRPGHDFVADRRPAMGPLGGLDSVLQERSVELEGKLLLVLPLDMPLLVTGTLKALLNAADGSESGAVFANGPLPMALRVKAGVPDTVGAVLAGEGKRSLGELVQALELNVLDAVQGAQMDNINRSEELARLRATAGRKDSSH
ncbi:MAG: molybdenum cofactor guanylyltransferase, partial [Wenzhouxiangellaceae bacterium]